jgi:hypothetical protein
MLSSANLQPAVLFLNGFRLGNHRGVHAAIFGPPFVKRGVGYRVLSAKLNSRNAGFSLLQHRHNLDFRKSALLHQNLLVPNTEKILLPNLFFFGGITMTPSPLF